MTNKTLGTILLVIMGVTFLTGVFEDSLTTTDAEVMYFLSGIGLLVFGIWASVRLIKTK